MPAGLAAKSSPRRETGCSSAISRKPATAACAWCEDSCKFARPAVTNSRPVMVGYQAAGAAPFIKGAMVDDPETVATAIRIGRPQSWELAWAASRESGGWFDALSDVEILQAQRLLAEREGIFCEPASAIALGGALRDVAAGKIAAGSLITCTLTGHGLKDPDTAIQQSAGGVIEIPATSDAVKRAILDNL